MPLPESPKSSLPSTLHLYHHEAATLPLRLILPPSASSSPPEASGWCVEHPGAVHIEWWQRYHAATGRTQRPTLLDTPESSVRDGIIDDFLKREGDSLQAAPIAQIDEHSLCQCFRHSGWWKNRRRVIASMHRTGQPSHRIASFASCGDGAWIMQADHMPERLKVTSSFCHDRLCEPCAQERARRIREVLCDLTRGRQLRFITLTLAAKGQSLKEGVDRLFKHFRALRATSLWSDAVDGGAAFLELKWNSKVRRWHPHLHIICEGRYIDQGKLSTCWHGITGDSFIVDVQAVRQEKGIASYVTKYVTKGVDGSVIATPEKLDEAMTALRGRRLCTCFGSWYGTPLSDAEDADFIGPDLPDDTWHAYCSFDVAIEGAMHGNPHYISILVNLGLTERLKSLVTMDTS